MKTKLLFLLLYIITISSTYAQNIYCNGPWGGAGAIGDPARWTYIGQAGNSNDASTGKGAVSYGYSYFDRFVRIGDWVVFLNSVDPSGSGNYSGLLGDNGLQLITYNGSQWVARSWSCGGTGQSLTASQVSKVAVSYVSFNLACRFANWVATGSVSSGAYTFASSAANANVTSINYAFQGVRLPTENEFYKAAYYNPTSGSYNTYGATNLSGGDPVQTDVSSNATLVNQSGSPYQLSMAGLYGGPNGTHCLWQIQAGQGDRSAYGLFNMVGGFHHLLTINQGGSQDATAGLMMFRPGNQLEGTSGQSKYWSYPGSASDAGWTMNAHLASPSFHLVIVGNECGGCPTLSDPVVTNGSRCGTGTVTTSLTTNCTTAGSSLHIYSEVGLTNDITSQFTIAGSSITTPSITSTKTYYAVCQSTSSATTCFSDSDAFTATVTTAPTATASATQPTCTGTNAPDNGKITIAAFTAGQRYQYTSGVTFTGTATPASITTIPVGGVITTTLPNTSGSYTVRIYHATDDACFVDRTVNITAAVCCTIPTTTATTTNATCTGPTANTDGKITIVGFTAGQRYQYTSGATFSGTKIPTSITAIPTGGVVATTLANTASSYTVRIYDATDNTCFVDRIVGTTVTDCSCPMVEAPAVGNASRCGTGTVVASITTLCATGSTLKIFSNSTLTTDVTSTFTVAVSNVTSPSILATATYYAACVDNTFTSCKSTGDSFILTITPPPTATASATQPSCTGTNSPNNGGLTIAGFTAGQRYQYTSGATFTGTATPASITAIPVGGVIASTLANTTGSYTIRIYDATDDACFIDRTINITAVACCTTPTAKGYGVPATCSNGSANNDASINLYNLANVTKYGYSIGLTYTGSAFASATTASGTTATITGLSGASTNITYTIRVFNGSNTCFDDIQVTVPFVGCNTSCIINGGADQLICEPTTTTNLPDATAAQEWIIGNNNPVAASINATTGVVTGMTVNGIYSFILRDKVNTTCADEVYIFRGILELPFVSSCESSFQLPTTTGAVWTVASGAASVTADGFITGMNTNGNYQFNVTFGGCSATITVEKITCAIVCIKPDAGADITMCSPKTGIDLADAAASTQWIAVAGNPATAIINASTGVISGMTAIGTYKFRLQTTADATCFDEMQIVVSAGDAAIALCNDGSTSYKLTAPANLTNVIWYNMAGQQVGTGNTLNVTSTTNGLADGSEAFYYEGKDGTATGCDVTLCCPVKFITQICCPIPNCGTVSVIKN